MACVIVNILFVSALTTPGANGKDAERAFYAMRDKLNAAKSLTACFQFTITWPSGASARGECALWVAENNRLRWELQPERLGCGTALIACDGKKVFDRNPNHQQTYGAYKDTARRFVEGITNYGSLVASALVFDESTRDKVICIVLSDFKLVAKERIKKEDTQHVRYTLSIKGERADSEVAKVDVWISKTNLPVKRVYARLSGWRTEEVYLDWGLDSSIDVKLFELPIEELEHDSDPDGKK
jgi:outer membrane lipoprotein-sorting protein